MKVEIISSSDKKTLCDYGNNFIADKKVIDIKFTSVITGKSVNDRVLIIYE